MPGLKQRLVAMFWAPEIAAENISQHPKFKKFPGGAYPQTPLASAYTLTYARTRIQRTTSTGKPDQCNFASAGPVISLSGFT